MKLVELILLEGYEHSKALEEVYPEKKSWTLQAKRTEVQELFGRKIVKEYIKKVQDDLRKEKVMSIVDKLEWLQSVVNDPNEKMRDRIKALEVANKLQGHDAPLKIQTEGNLNIGITPELNSALDKLFN